MISDLQGAGDLNLDTDICVIGAGAAGISIAQALAGTRLNVCLLEGGGLADEPDTQALYQGVATGHPMDLDVGRYRTLGGSTTQWTGRCARLQPIDFKRRDWIPHSGWPIGPDDLDRWYRAAEEVCGFPRAWDDDRAELDALGATDRTESVEPFLWRYAPIGNRRYRNWAVEYRRTLEQAQNIRLLLHANVTEFVASDDRSRITSVVARSLTGDRVEVRARAFVLAGGGLENTRLLLASEDTVPGGLGSSRDLIGRFFMQHPRGRIGRLDCTPGASLALQDRYNIFVALAGLQRESGFALTEAAQRRHELLNASAILTFQAEPTSGWEGFKSLAQRQDIATSLARIARDPVSVSRNLWRRGVRKRHAAYPTSHVDLVIDLEQEPDPDSRVTLSDQRDALGMQRATVDWRLSERERTTSRFFAEALRTMFEARGYGSVTTEPWLYETGRIGDELSGTFHHIATLRMSGEASEGVVDPDGRVWGTDNLYATGCAVFPTGGQANPTFTIVALALRLADHLRRAAAT